MKYNYTTDDQVCSSVISLDMDGDLVKDVVFIGGCNGNLQGICSLVKGMRYSEIKERLGGIRCGFKDTSCPDQLVKAIEEAMKNQ